MRETSRWIKDIFEKADQNNDRSLQFDEILELLKQMNVKVDKDYAQTIFKVNLWCKGELDW